MKKILLLVLLFAGLNVHAQKHDKEYYYNLGNEKYKLEDYKAAIECYTKAIKLDSMFWDAFYLRGKAKISNGKYDDGLIDIHIYHFIVDKQHSQMEISQFSKKFIVDSLGNNGFRRNFIYADTLHKNRALINGIDIVGYTKEQVLRLLGKPNVESYAKDPHDDSPVHKILLYLVRSNPIKEYLNIEMTGMSDTSKVIHKYGINITDDWLSELNHSPH
jgi:tetratricopeptide (TPR) repeat protein